MKNCDKTIDMFPDPPASREAPGRVDIKKCDKCGRPSAHVYRYFKDRICGFCLWSMYDLAKNAGLIDEDEENAITNVRS